MMNLAEYRNRNTRLADYLPWVALVGEGMVLNKDGSLQRTARFRGPDLDSAVPAELVAVAGRLNNAFRHRPRTPPAPRPGSTRVAIMPASMRTRYCAASQTAPIASFNSSTPSCRNVPGSMTARR